MTIKLLEMVYDSDGRYARPLPALSEGFYWVPMGRETALYGPGQNCLGHAHGEGLTALAREQGAYILQSYRQCRERLTDWMVDPEEGSGHCVLRAVVGTDPHEVANRRAYIEKSARVCVDGEWLSVYKGRGGSEDPAIEGLYGFDPESRAAADQALIDLGYVLDTSR